MEKSFWLEIAKKDFAIPETHKVADLTDELFSYLGSTDPELRDDIAYTTFAYWQSRGNYAPNQLRRYIELMRSNLSARIGEQGTDSVFLRTFSALLLAEIIHGDNKKPYLEKSEVLAVLDDALWYLANEKDSRGYIPVKGWAHSLAHTADMLRVLARNHHVEAQGLQKILTGIAQKIITSTEWLYQNGEDERLANAVIDVLNRNLLPQDAFQLWLDSLINPNNDSWKRTFENEGANIAFNNTRNLLRSITLKIIANTDLPQQETFQLAAIDALQNLKQF